MQEYTSTDAAARHQLITSGSNAGSSDKQPDVGQTSLVQTNTGSSAAAAVPLQQQTAVQPEQEAVQLVVCLLWLLLQIMLQLLLRLVTIP